MLFNTFAKQKKKYQFGPLPARYNKTRAVIFVDLFEKHIEFFIPCQQTIQFPLPITALFFHLPQRTVYHNLNKNLLVLLCKLSDTPQFAEDNLLQKV